MSKIVLDIPDASLESLNADATAASSEIRMAAAMKLYELGRLSSGAAAELAGIPKVVFLEKLAEYDVDTFSLTEAELRRETPLR
jgi:predicted HTH domain antitoxin